MDIRKSFNKSFFNIKLGVLALGLLSPLASQAFVIDKDTTTSEIFTVNYSLANGATDPNTNTNNTGYDLMASVSISMTAFDTANDFISLVLTVANTTDSWDGVGTDPEIGLQQLAFGTTPDATAVEFTDDADGEFIEAHLFGNPDSALDLGNTLSLDTVSTTGTGASNRLLAGESDTFFLKISFTDLIDAGVTFSPFSSKWQTNPDSFQFAGTEPGSGPGPGPGPSIPEPNSLALLGLGALLLRWSSRKAKA